MHNYLSYIDPGTGSMLFSILLGTVGAFAYLIRLLVLKLKFKISGGRRGKVSAEKIPIVIFSDHKRYWTTFREICKELDRRGIGAVYMTASPDDPALEEEFSTVKCEFIGEGNKAFSKLNFLNAYIVLSTTPSLDVYGWKRSKNVNYYIHILHSSACANQYRLFGLDYYDAVWVSGPHQVEQIRELEQIRKLPAKDIRILGLPYMDALYERKLSAPAAQKSEVPTVLLAPTWGKISLFNRYGTKLIDALAATGYKIVIRPHPQSFSSEADMIEELQKKYPNGPMLEWNSDIDNFDALNSADIMISDFSGVVYDFILIFDKPVIYSLDEVDFSQYDGWYNTKPFWNFKTLPTVGKELTAESLDNIKEMIDELMASDEYAQGRAAARATAWNNIGKSPVTVVDNMLEKLDELKKEAEGADAAAAAVATE